MSDGEWNDPVRWKYQWMREYHIGPWKIRRPIRGATSSVYTMPRRSWRTRFGWGR